MTAGPLLVVAGSVILLLAAACGGDDTEPVASLEGTSWSLAEGEGISIPDDAEMTIEFAGGNISGSGGCNRFRGQYSENGDALTFGPIAATRRACSEELMAAERAYFDAIENTSTWSASESELTLSSLSGAELLRYESNDS
jgi:heat shock protein HslJ